jgi:hypothetical protein
MIIKTEKGNVELGRALFWEIDEQQIGQALINSDDWVIQRVFEYGNLDEIDTIIEYYGSDRTVGALDRLKHDLNPMAKTMAWYYFGLNF